jgi:hypothetical protein
MNQKEIEEAFKTDENLQKGIKQYQRMEEKANEVAEEISSNLIESIVKNSSQFNISIAVLAVAKSLSHLASYLYDTEEEFLSEIKKARTATVSDVIPALLDPQPCGLCEECKNGNEMECIKPEVRGDYTTSRFLPILCNMIIEYDLFNKVIHMHTVGMKAQQDEASIKKSDENNKEE